MSTDAVGKAIELRDGILALVPTGTQVEAAITDDDRVARNLFPDHVSWKRTQRILNENSPRGHEYRIIYSSCISLGVPLWDWLQSTYDASATSQCNSWNITSRSDDLKRYNTDDFSKVLG